MQEKNHQGSSVIDLALGVIVAALTTWLVVLLKRRNQPANFSGSPEILSEGMTISETKSISTQDHQMEKFTAQNPPVEAGPPFPSRKDAVHLSARKANLWSLPTKYMVGMGLVVFILWLLYFSRGSVTLILFAGLLALVAGGAIDFFKKRFKMRKGLAVTATYLLIVIIVFSIPFLLMPPIIRAVSSLVSIDWQTVSNNVVQRLDQTATQASAIPLVGSKIQDSLTSLSGLLENSSTSAQNVLAPAVTLESMAGTIGRTLGGLASVLGPLISGVVALVFMLLMSLQMTIGGGDIRKGLVDILPSAFRDEANNLLDGTILIWKSFLRGQVLLMFSMGMATWLLNVLLGTPQPLLLGLLAGFLEIIPSLGPFLAFVPALILALLFGSTNFVGLDPWVFALIVSVGYLLLSTLENQLLVPRIMGGAVDLPPLVVLIGIIIAGSTIGLAGVFLAVPVMATGKELFLYLYGKVLETEAEPMPEIEEEKPKWSLEKFLQSAGSRVRGLFGGSKELPPG